MQTSEGKKKQENLGDKNAKSSHAKQHLRFIRLQSAFTLNGGSHLLTKQN